MCSLLVLSPLPSLAGSGNTKMIPFLILQEGGILKLKVQRAVLVGWGVALSFNPSTREVEAPGTLGVEAYIRGLDQPRLRDEILSGKEETSS